MIFSVRAKEDIGLGKQIYKEGTYKDRTGEQIGDFTLLCFDSFKGNRAQWQAICVCGTGAVIVPNNANPNRGAAGHCGCKTHDKYISRGKRWREEKYLGLIINGWEIVQVHEGDDPYFGPKEHCLPILAECTCCNTRKWVDTRNLKDGLVRCPECPFVSKIHNQVMKWSTHSKRTGHRVIWDRWFNMNHRCSDPHHPRYGGRGIYVCEAWHFTNPYGFQNYLDWVTGHSDWKDLLIVNKYQVDRRDNDGPYSPENCRIVSRQENMNNTSRTRWVEYNGERLPFGQLIKKYSKIDVRTVQNRIDKLGWSLEDALNIPSVNSKPRSRRPFNEL